MVYLWFTHILLVAFSLDISANHLAYNVEEK